MRWPEDFINQIICGDCLEVMGEMPDNCVDTIITDPPYGIGFMGKEWDIFKSDFVRKSVEKSNRNTVKKDGMASKSAIRYDESLLGHQKYQDWCAEWMKECLRVSKPGATFLCCGSPRVYHHIALATERAGWIIKDCIMWLYGSGFPKANDISQMLDKAECKSRLINILGRKPTQKEFREAWEGKKCTVCGGVGKAINPNVKDPELADYWLNKPCRKCNGSGIEQKGFREIIGKYELPDVADGKRKKGWECTNTTDVGVFGVSGQQDITTPATPEATLWDGWKSHGLKPSYEPILVCMKPNEGSYANNALKWGVAGLNIDGGRIGTDRGNEREYDKEMTSGKTGSNKGKFKMGENQPRQDNWLTKGRYPANVILDEEAGKLLDEQSGTLKSGKNRSEFPDMKNQWLGRSYYPEELNYGDSGGASRFFYCAKASKAERNRGCEGLEEKERANINKIMGKAGDFKTGSGNDRTEKFENNHPTVKPLALMKYLYTLTKTPTGGIVLDPFCGSGTTLMACKELKRDYIGIDNQPEYCEIAIKRVNATPELLF